LNVSQLEVSHMRK